MKQVIKDIDGNILFECEADSFKEAVERAVRERVPLNKANLRYADLVGVNFWRANLSGADLSEANLFCANFFEAYLLDANLSSASLHAASIQNASLCRADLSGADLREADLRGTSFYKADLRGADFSGADLRFVDFNDVDFSKAKYDAELPDHRRVVPKEGDFIGWKKCSRGVIVKLLIPEDAKRSNAYSRKCRANKVIVLEVIGADVGVSKWNSSVTYRVGETVYSDYWDSVWWNECSPGIHFFLTRQEAEDY